MERRQTLLKNVSRIPPRQKSQKASHASYGADHSSQLMTDLAALLLLELRFCETKEITVRVVV